MGIPLFVKFKFYTHLRGGIEARKIHTRHKLHKHPEKESEKEKRRAHFVFWVKEIKINTYGMAGLNSFESCNDLQNGMGETR